MLGRDAFGGGRELHIVAVVLAEHLVVAGPAFELAAFKLQPNYAEKTLVLALFILRSAAKHGVVLTLLLHIRKSHYLIPSPDQNFRAELRTAMQMVELPHLYTTFAGSAIARTCISLARAVKNFIIHHQTLEQMLVSIVVRSYLIHRENIYPKSCLHGPSVPRDIGLRNGTLAIAHPSEWNPAVLHIAAVKKLEPLGTVGPGKTLIILAEHLHVHIVIPGNETFVTDSSKAGPVGK